MKQLFSLFAAILLSASAHAQSAIYICRQTGAVGFSHSATANGNPLSEVEYTAMLQCRANGGLTCTRLVADNRPGWWAFIRGRNYNNKRLVAFAYGRASEKDAIDEARKSYVEMGGTNAGNFKVITWQVAPAPARVLAENRKK